MLNKLKGYFVWIKSKFDALEKNVQISLILLFSIIFLAGIVAILGTCTIDWLNLMTTMIGTILFPILIWYFSSVRSDEIKKNEQQIGVLNAVFAEIIIISKNLSRFATETISKISIAKQEIDNITYSKTMYEAMPGSFSHPSSINQTQAEILNEITYKFQIRYSAEDIKFISVTDSNLFLCLYTLFSNIEIFNDVINKTNVALLEAVERHKDTVKNEPNNELNSLLNLFKYRVKQYNALCFSMFGILDDLHKKILPKLVSYADKNFTDKIGMNDKDEITKTNKALEEALKLVNLDK